MKKSDFSMQVLKKVVASMGKKNGYFLKVIKRMMARGQLWKLKGTGTKDFFMVIPDMGQQTQQQARGNSRKEKNATKKKGRQAVVSRKGRNKSRRQKKATVQSSSKTSKMPSYQAYQNYAKA